MHDVESLQDFARSFDEATARQAHPGWCRTRLTAPRGNPLMLFARSLADHYWLGASLASTGTARGAVPGEKLGVLVRNHNGLMNRAPAQSIRLISGTC